MSDNNKNPKKSYLSIPNSDRKIRKSSNLRGSLIDSIELEKQIYSLERKTEENIKRKIKLSQKLSLIDLDEVPSETLILVKLFSFKHNKI